MQLCQMPKPSRTPSPPLPSRVNTLDQDCYILTTVTHFHLHLDMRAKVPS